MSKYKYSTPPRSLRTDRSQYSSMESFRTQSQVSNKRAPGRLKIALKVFSDLVDDPFSRLTLQPSHIKELMTLYQGLNVIDQYQVNHKKRWMPILLRQAFNQIKVIACMEDNLGRSRDKNLSPNRSQMDHSDATSVEILNRSRSNSAVRTRKKQQTKSTLLRYEVLSLSSNLARQQVQQSLGASVNGKRLSVCLKSPYEVEVVVNQTLRAVSLKTSFSKVFLLTQKNYQRIFLYELKAYEPPISDQVLPNQQNTQAYISHTEKSPASYHKRRDSSPNMQMHKTFDQMSTAHRTPHYYPSLEHVEQDKSILTIESPDVTFSTKKERLSTYIYQIYDVVIISKKNRLEYHKIIAEGLISKQDFSSTSGILQVRRSPNQFSVKKSHLPYTLHEILLRKRIIVLKKFFRKIQHCSGMHTGSLSNIDVQIHGSIHDSFDNELKQAILGSTLDKLSSKTGELNSQSRQQGFEQIREHAKQKKYKKMGQPLRILFASIGHPLKFKYYTTWQVLTSIQIPQRKHHNKLIQLTVNLALKKIKTALQILRSYQKSNKTVDTVRKRLSHQRSSSAFVFPNLTLMLDEEPSVELTPQYHSRTKKLASRLAEMRSQEKKDRKDSFKELLQILHEDRDSKQQSGSNSKGLKSHPSIDIKASNEFQPYVIKIFSPDRPEAPLSRKKDKSKFLNKTNQFIIVNGALRISSLFMRIGWKKLIFNVELKKMQFEQCENLRRIFKDYLEDCFKRIKTTSIQWKRYEQKMKENKKKLLKQLILPQIKEKQQQAELTSSKSAKSKLIRSFSAESNTKHVHDGEEVTIERNVQFDFFKKMICQVQTEDLSQFDSPQETRKRLDTVGSRPPLLKDIQKSRTERQLFSSLGPRGNPLSSRKARKTLISPKVIMVFKEDKNKKPGYLYQLIKQNENLSDDSSMSSESEAGQFKTACRNMITTRKIAQHIAYQSKRASILEMSMKFKRRAGNINENEIILIQNRFRVGKKILYVLILLGLILSIAYNWRHFLYDFHL